MSTQVELGGWSDLKVADGKVQKICDQVLV